MRDDESNITMDIKVHQFVNKSTWSLHLALHVNDIFVGTASANLGNSRYDSETVTAALKCLKNEYFKAIGSPMRYKGGKLVFLQADPGLVAKEAQRMQPGNMEHASTSGQPATTSH